MAIRKERYVGKKISQDPAEENPAIDTDVTLNQNMPTEDGLDAEPEDIGVPGVDRSPLETRSSVGRGDGTVREQIQKHGDSELEDTKAPKRNVQHNDLVDTYANSRTLEDLEKKPKAKPTRSLRQSPTGGYTDLGEGRSRVIKRTKKKH